MDDSRKEALSQKFEEWRKNQPEEINFFGIVATKTTTEDGVLVYTAPEDPLWRTAEEQRRLLIWTGLGGFFGELRRKVWSIFKEMVAKWKRS